MNKKLSTLLLVLVIANLALVFLSKNSHKKVLGENNVQVSVEVVNPNYATPSPSVSPTPASIISQLYFNISFKLPAVFDFTRPSGEPKEETGLPNSNRLDNVWPKPVSPKPTDHTLEYILILIILAGLGFIIWRFFRRIMSRKKIGGRKKKRRYF